MFTLQQIALPPARKLFRKPFCSHIRMTISARFLQRTEAASRRSSKQDHHMSDRFFATHWCNVKSHSGRSGSELVRVRTVIHWDGGKYSEVRTVFSSIISHLYPLGQPLGHDVRHFFQFCAVAVHILPDNFSNQHEKLSVAERTLPKLKALVFLIIRCFRFTADNAVVKSLSS